ncbi:hypothetical protein [Burkholderia ubonensis]|nr:hypothetical protein [Burkholderia ubonensis]
MSARMTFADERPVAAPAAHDAAGGTAGGAAELLYQVDINRQGLDETALLIKASDGEFYVSADDLKRWRLKVPDVRPLAGADAPFYPLKSIAGLACTVDEENLTMSISVPADAFVGASFDETARNRPPAVEPGLGGFFNYDLLAEQAAGQTHGSGLFELGFFNRFLP